MLKTQSNNLHLIPRRRSRLGCGFLKHTNSYQASVVFTPSIAALGAVWQPKQRFNNIQLNHHTPPSQMQPMLKHCKITFCCYQFSRRATPGSCWCWEPLIGPTLWIRPCAARGASTKNWRFVAQQTADLLNPPGRISKIPFYIHFQIVVCSTGAVGTMSQLT